MAGEVVSHRNSSPPCGAGEPKSPPFGISRAGEGRGAFRLKCGVIGSNELSVLSRIGDSYPFLTDLSVDSSRDMRAVKSLWRLPLYVQYLIPVLGIGLILLFRSNSTLLNGQPFAFSGAIVAISALCGGLGPGLLACAGMIGFGSQRQQQANGGVLTADTAVTIASSAFVLVLITVVIHFLRVALGRYDESLGRRDVERHKLTFLLDSIQHGFIIVDRDWRLSFANKAVLQLAGRSEVELLGTLLWELTGGELTEFRIAVEAARVAGVEVRQELSFNSRVYDVRAIPQADETLIYAQDMTERRKLEMQRAALFELERVARHRAESDARAKDDFLLTISHELRTPLTTILGWTEIMESDPSPTTITNGGTAIRRSAKNQEHMVGQLLDLASLNGDRFALNPELFDLNDAVVDAAKSLEVEAKERGHVLEVASAPVPLLVRGDQDQISKALKIIVDNSIRYTLAPGEIRITASEQESAAVVEIKDNGKGIEPEFLPRIFERFLQSERAMTRTYNGLGLGLTIAKAIIDLHGGEIEVFSAGKDQGSLTRVRLPLSAAEAHLAIRSRPGKAAAPRMEGLHVLLVDDDPGTCDVLGHFLSSEGAKVTVATSAIEALSAALERPFDVMVSDVGMPGMSGLELMERLRADPKTSELRALALSAYYDSEVIRLCRESGYGGFATKPIGRTEFLAKLSELF